MKSSQFQKMQSCFKILKIKNRQNEEAQCFVPTCVQFKMKDITDINFDNLSAKINGTLCISFLIFTNNKNLQYFLCERLYWNNEQMQELSKNRQKKILRTKNYVPIQLNKDIYIKLPTTSTKQVQIQSFKSQVYYKKNGLEVGGIRIFYVVRKEFTVEILKNNYAGQFLAPFNFVNLDFGITIHQMAADNFSYKQQINKNRQKSYHQQFKFNKIGFNILNIEEPYLDQNLSLDLKIQKLAPMIAISEQTSFGKFQLVQTQLEAYTHDERNLIDEDDEEKQQTNKYLLFADNGPVQLSFKPFKYAVFKIPLYRFPVVDIMTIFIPLWLLSVVSAYIFYQSAEIMNRIINVAALMIAYSAIQPMVRQIIPEATSLTLVDLLIYMQLIVNILFLTRSIDVRVLFDNPDPDNPDQVAQSNANYNRWDDGLFIASVILTIADVIIVLILIIAYLWKKRSYRGKNASPKRFSISNQENWTLKLLHDRSFARYKESLIFLN